MDNRITHTRQCPNCGKAITCLRPPTWVAKKKTTESCTACRITGTGYGSGQRARSKRYEGIALSWFNRLIREAARRNLEQTITIEYLWELYVAQGRVCALSGCPIVWGIGNGGGTASVDRIDSSKGYIFGNVQVVHKHINMMKNVYEQDHFIYLCGLVTANAKAKLW